MVVFDPFDWRLHEDPYPVYRQLRDEAPAYWNPERGFWALSRHADVLAGFKDVRRFSNADGVSLERSASGEASAAASFLAMDPPEHDRLRGLVSRGFTPRRVAELEPEIRRLAALHLGRVLDAGRCDFIQDFAARIPMDVVSELLGVPEPDRDRLRTWADLVLHREDGVVEVPPAAIQSSARLFEYFGALVGERRRRPGDDLASALTRAELDGERLADRDIVAFLFLMIIAGNETTTKLLGNALYWLERHPDVRRRVWDDPTRIPAWVEETLRYDNSTQALARTLRADVPLHGAAMPAGARVLLLVGAANRDERVFPEPERFDIDRDHTESLSFGKGTHFCLGASLARLEARVALETVHAAFADWHIDPGGLVRMHSANVRGFAAMPLAFTTR
jgi:cytochrome P450